MASGPGFYIWQEDATAAQAWLDELITETPCPSPRAPQPRHGPDTRGAAREPDTKVS